MIRQYALTLARPPYYAELRRHAAQLVQRVNPPVRWWIAMVTKETCETYVRKNKLRAPGRNAKDTAKALYVVCEYVHDLRLYRGSLRRKHDDLVKESPLEVRLLRRLYKPYEGQVSKLIAPLVRHWVYHDRSSWLAVSRGEASLDYMRQSKSWRHDGKPSAKLVLPKGWVLAHRAASMEVYKTSSCTGRPFLVVARHEERTGEYRGVPWKFWRIQYIDRRATGPVLCDGLALDFCGKMWRVDKLKGAHLRRRYAVAAKFVRERLTR